MESQFTRKAYSEYLNTHRLVGSRDLNTGEIFLPPRPINPKNHSAEMEWVELSGQGTLAAFTVVYIATTAMIEAGYSRKTPYCVGIVKLDEGPMISAQILGFDVSSPETIKIGTLLTIAFIDRGEGEAKQTFLAFQPLD
jgi:uncharacterized protein